VSARCLRSVPLAYAPTGVTASKESVALVLSQLRSLPPLAVILKSHPRLRHLREGGSLDTLGAAAPARLGQPAATAIVPTAGTTAAAIKDDLSGALNSFLGSMGRVAPSDARVPLPQPQEANSQVLSRLDPPRS
jgi:hypothetical protein